MHLVIRQPVDAITDVATIGLEYFVKNALMDFTTKTVVAYVVFV